MLWTRSYWPVALAICFFGWCSLARAADDAKLAITDLSQVDADFPLQGEYFGAVSHSQFDAPYLGLQVIAQGKANFEAVLLRGGLPGGGWDRKTTTRLGGSRHESGLQLDGSPYRILVTPTEAVVQTELGDELARLRKMKRVSLTQHAAPPSGAIVLFDGQSTEELEGAKITDDGYLGVGGLTKRKVQDFQMHLEFRTPYMPNARGQARGNSGIYIQQRYEVQVLDSFGLEGVENECGGLYRQQRPAVNMCLPPLSWQTYDIYFTAARFDSQGNKSANARITVLHNGEPIHENHSIVAKTGAGQPESAEPRPILFQNHNDPVRFRNVWLVPVSSGSGVWQKDTGPSDYASVLSGPCNSELVSPRCYTSYRRCCH